VTIILENKPNHFSLCKSDLEGFNKKDYFQRSSSALRAPPQEEDIEIVYFTSPISFLTKGEIKIKITPATKA
jgi:hypothetical protein